MPVYHMCSCKAPHKYLVTSAFISWTKISKKLYMKIQVVYSDNLSIFYPINA